MRYKRQYEETLLALGGDREDSKLLVKYVLVLLVSLEVSETKIRERRAS